MYILEINLLLFLFLQKSPEFTRYFQKRKYSTFFKAKLVWNELQHEKILGKKGLYHHFGFQPDTSFDLLSFYTFTPPTNSSQITKWSNLMVLVLHTYWGFLVVFSLGIKGNAEAVISTDPSPKKCNRTSEEFHFNITHWCFVIPTLTKLRV